MENGRKSPAPGRDRRRAAARRRRRAKKKTRNRMLGVACVMVIAYTVVNVVYGFIGLRTGGTTQLDSTLTAEVFAFAKWLCGGTAAITVAKTLKGATNSDEDEVRPEENQNGGCG